jgi:hypothetical protein
MPIPKPKKRERQRKFISRCMKQAKNEYPNRSKRIAICFTSFRKSRGKFFYGYGFTNPKSGKRFFIGPFKTKKIASINLEKAKKKKIGKNIRLIKESLFFFKKTGQRKNVK